MPYLFSLILWMIALQIHAQPIIRKMQLCHEAEFWYHEGQPSRSLKLYDEASKHSPLKARDDIFVALNHLSLMRYDSFEHHFLRAVHKQPGSYSYLLSKHDSIRLLLPEAGLQSLKNKLEQVYQNRPAIQAPDADYLGQLYDSCSFYAQQLYKAKEQAKFELYLLCQNRLDAYQADFVRYIQANGYPPSYFDLSPVLFQYFSFEQDSLQHLLYPQLLLDNIEPFDYAAILEYNWYKVSGFDKTCLFYTLVENKVANMSCGEAYWPEMIQRRYETGVSIFYKGNPRQLSKARTKLPWAENLDLLKAYLNSGD